MRSDEREFQLDLWSALNRRYRSHGVFWQNTTGRAGTHHDPWPTRGAGDIIGCLCGRWVELELKTTKGTLRAAQIIRRQLITTRCGGVYMVVRPDTVGSLYATLDAMVTGSVR